MSAIGHGRDQKSHSALFIHAYCQVQGLPAAKRDLALAGEMRRLDRFEAVIIDDIAYVEQQQEEMEVLFTFLAK